MGSNKARSGQPALRGLTKSTSPSRVVPQLVLRRGLATTSDTWSHGYAVHQYDIEQAFIQDGADFEQYVRPCRGFGDHPFVHDKDGKAVVDETGAAALGKPRLGKNGKPLIWKVAEPCTASSEHATRA